VRAVELVVGDDLDAVPRARKQVTGALSDVPPEVVDDVRLVVTELVTNGLLHGRGPVHVRAEQTTDGVRIEVEDAGPHLPVLPQPSTEAMTGRGLALVSRVASSWGITPVRGGKVVWVELTAGADGGLDAQPAFTDDLDVDALDVDALLAAFGDDEQFEPTWTVELGAVSTDLLLSAKSHIDNIVREFTLEAASGASPGQGPGNRTPSELATLVATVVHGFDAARNSIKRQALAAARRGDREVLLSLTLPVSAADAGEQYLAALDEADRYARNARLLTLETPPVHQVFRRWYVQTLVDQLRAAAVGAAPPPASTFPDMLGEALTRVAPLEAQAARLELLQQITAELTAAATVEGIARTVVQHAAAALGAHNAIVYELAAPGELRMLAADGTVDAAALRQFERARVTADLPVGAVVLSGETLVCRDRADLVRRFPLLADSYRAELSLLIAPLVVGDHTLGVLSLTFAGPARIEEQAQKAFLDTLAGVTAQALERALASNQAARANERLSFLAEASVILSSTLEYRAVLEAVAQLVVPRTADWCSIQLLDEGRLEPVAVTHFDPQKLAASQALRERYPTDMQAATGAANVVRTGRSELYADITDDMLVASAVDEQHLQLVRGLGMSSVLMVPLTGRTGTIGVLTLIGAESGRRYDTGDVAFAEDLARRAALAVENAHAYREQSGRVATLTRVAEAAQHAILAPPPARIGPVGLAARYASAAVDALVGGDLYEYVRRPGAVRLLIGDVRGKGLGAVRTATVVLGAFRDAAADVDDLRAVAAQMDRRLRPYLDAEDFVTALLAEVRDDGTFVVASCGHPPPLLAADGQVAPVALTPSVPLGLGAAPALTRGRLPPGSRLLLYTDGILEARDPHGRFVDLMALAQPLTTGRLDEAVDAVLAGLRAAVGGELGDDLALLIAEYSPA